MILYNAQVFRGEEGFIRGGVEIEEGRIRRVFSGAYDFSEKTGCEAEDLQGSYLIPGLIDIHIHGAAGADFSDGDLEGLQKMGAYLASQGITSFAPASMSLPYEALAKAYQTAAAYHKNTPDACASLAGIHMEGPFFSEKRKGAQSSEYLKDPDIQAFYELNTAAEGLIRQVDVAPELPKAMAFIREISSVCKVSLAHTDADYDTAKAAFEAGASHVTHLFNAMPPLLHRAPGMIAAAAERDDVAAELICDGVHIHESMIRLAFKLFPGRICLISDASRVCGMPEGVYELGGQEVIYKDGASKLHDGTIAGAASNVFEDMRNAVRFGIPLESAVKAATETPAKEIGCFKDRGSIKTGKRADLLVLDQDLELNRVYISGKRIK